MICCFIDKRGSDGSLAWTRLSDSATRRLYGTTKQREPGGHGEIPFKRRAPKGTHGAAIIFSPHFPRTEGGPPAQRRPRTRPGGAAPDPRARRCPRCPPGNGGQLSSPLLPPAPWRSFLFACLFINVFSVIIIPPPAKERSERRERERGPHQYIHANATSSK